MTRIYLRTDVLGVYCIIILYMYMYVWGSARGGAAVGMF